MLSGVTKSSNIPICFKISPLLPKLLCGKAYSFFDNQMKTINIIGAGRVGQTLAHLWKDQGFFTIQQILTRSSTSAEKAVAFIGQGLPIDSLDDLQPADLTLISLPDQFIEEISLELVQKGKLKKQSLVFHCSGSLASNVLLSCRKRECSIASVHPVKSFADPQSMVQNFAGTWCGIEGDEQAQETLKGAFEAIGGLLFDLKAETKIHYHTASVMVCNYLVTLMDRGVETYKKAGLPEAVALQLMEPLVRGTMDNVFQLGPVAALTGPITRGDTQVIAKQEEAMEQWDEDMGTLYRTLGRFTLNLAERQGGISKQALSRLQDILT
ncbi:MAG: hypothetical protein COB67_05575 [SAR324 cluster bacterium]|uniref:DUF2520 domain-containing protein n=1 Tax=SAR324 cluster bacterium TaxID=2024889 RepID=A0A2A4T650_9DELT|nr:MAG: hypothetical protein COB67_05575 [SAR324 cluster bacterium]